jgi:hypothetical protein
MTVILRSNWPACLIGIVLFCFLIEFLARFLVKAISLGRNLEQGISSLEEIGSQAPAGVTDLDHVAALAMATDTLDHLWREYAKTLHPQREPDELGRNRIVRWRATALAESFFTDQALVDSPLRTDYYKHLPGILTGIGIIGTFSGLIQGLLHFNVSADPALAEKGLSNLLSAVGHAFWISGSAILLAMLLTFVEKWIVTGLYEKVERLQQRVNRLFTTGAGDEYLERIVKAAETSATQAVQIKDSLVADLKQILSDVTAQQVEASARHSNMISVDVGKAIADSLGPPMERISNAVENVKSNQGEAVSKLLVDVLASFSGQMREMFGGQMTGIGQLLQTTNEAMQATATKFEQLAANMDLAGKSAADAMSERLSGAVVAMEARQQMLNHQMSEFVDQIRTLVAQSQTEASHKLQETLTTLGEQVAAVVSQLHSQVESSANRQEEQTARINRETGAAIGTISGQVEQLIAQSMQTNQSLQASVAALSSSTKDSIAKMNSGAEMLYVASSDFAKAGHGVADSIRLSGDAVEKIREVSQSLVGASNTTQQVSAEYARSRDVFAVMVGDLKLTVENAKREAAMTGEVLANLRHAAEQLSVAEKQAEDYLAGISEVLGKAHQAFAENVVKTLRTGNADFHKQLTDAVAHLSGGIQDLGDFLEKIPARQ